MPLATVAASARHNVVLPAPDCDKTSVVPSRECDFDSDDNVTLATVAASARHDVVLPASQKYVFDAEDDVPLSKFVGANSKAKVS